MIFSADTTAQVERMLHEIREEVASRRLKRRSTNEELGAITISAGFAEMHPGEAPTSLMERADTALYDSKHAGRNRVTSAEAKKSAAA